jgi:hypothetical protein
LGLAANRRAALWVSKTVSENRRQVLAKRNGRSRLSNGYALPRSVDQRSKWPRRYNDLFIMHINDLGGFDLVSSSEVAIIKRAVTLEVECEQLEEKFALRGRAELNELETFQRMSNTMRRHYESVGLKRRSRDVTPSLSDILRADQETQRQRQREQRHIDAAARVVEVEAEPSDTS